MRVRRRRRNRGIVQVGRVVLVRPFLTDMMSRVARGRTSTRVFAAVPQGQADGEAAIAFVTCDVVLGFLPLRKEWGDFVISERWSEESPDQAFTFW